MNKKNISLLLMLTASLAVQAQVMLPYQNPDLSFHDRAVDLVSRLSREEKCAQLGNNVAENPKLPSNCPSISIGTRRFMV